ncbi:G-protein coupled receptor GRL101-like [Littorina saxatilis]|uniref:G-protein coupled receptor GRL101-like n=1 Tax=Littorina saxatilis TaxID=31220 RepID=UPI0038B63384
MTCTVSNCKVFSYFTLTSLLCVVLMTSVWSSVQACSVDDGDFSYDHLVFTSQNVSECFGSIRGYYASSGVVAYQYNPSSTNSTRAAKDKLFSRTCMLEVVLPPDTIARLDFSDVNAWCSSSELIIDSDRLKILEICSGNQRIVIDLWQQSVPTMYSTTRCLRFRIIQTRWNVPFSFAITFTAISRSLLPGLEKVQVTEQKGYIQTPGLDSGQPFLPVMSSNLTVSGPPGHRLMLSFSQMDIGPSSDHRLTLHLWDHLGDKMTLQFSGDVIPDPKVFRANVLEVRFHAGAAGESRGFRLWFSFHNSSALPRNVFANQWNCSVPFWPDFEQHFPCNLVTDCVGGEDEMRCPYTGHCGLGALTLSGRCYHYVILPMTSTRFRWEDAVETCALRHGGYLASLNTPEEWRDVIAVLNLRRYEYGYTWHWADGTLALFFNITNRALDTEYYNCKLPTTDWILATGRDGNVWYYGNCAKKRLGALCEVDPTDSELQPSWKRPPAVVLPNVSHSHFGETFYHCPGLHFTHTFLACDLKSACAVESYNDVCSADLTSRPVDFECRSGFEKIPYTLVCDHRSDCSDDSDEDFCVFDTCEPASLDCGNKQNTRISLCAESHFQCGEKGYCLPVYARCNGVWDCTDREDESDCDSYTCPGFYRCRDSLICLHASHVCDGHHQCPQRDDELLCNLTCPEQCVCHGMEFFCAQPFPAQLYPELRFLYAAGTGMTPRDLADNSLLIYLSLARCSLTHLHNLILANLRVLDLSDNDLGWLRSNQLGRSANLHTLVLSGNPLVSITDDVRLPAVRVLDVSRVAIEDLVKNLTSVFIGLHSLNASKCGVDTVQSPGLGPLSQLRIVDLRGSDLLHFPPELLAGLTRLHTVHADNYKLCCQAVLPAGFNPNHCHVPPDAISSCDSLLKTDLFRVITAVFSAVAVLGNLASFVVRVCVQKSGGSLGYSVFVTHLSVSDLLMGVYLAIILVADWWYRGAYVWEDEAWKASVACRLAGVLSLTSSEVSAFVVCLITLDRLLVLRFPFSQLRFSPRSAHVASALAWLIGFTLASAPLLPSLAFWRFYGQSGMCVPLPVVSRNDFAGYGYSFGIMIVMNLGLFLLTALGQVFVYLSIRASAISTSDSARKSKDLTIARRLTAVVVSDFLCWFPISVLGVLASRGVSLPGEVSVAVAIFVLPLNSALNPFLYTLNTILERRRQEREKRLHQRLLSAMRDGGGGHGVVLPSVTSEVAMETFSIWLVRGLLTREKVARVLEERTGEEEK